jgi:hypothetical protein
MLDQNLYYGPHLFSKHNYLNAPVARRGGEGVGTYNMS